jgi:hypothetical protein
MPDSGPALQALRHREKQKELLLQQNAADGIRLASHSSIA